MAYSDFLSSKRISVQASGFEVRKDAFNPKMFEYQRDCTWWGLRKGKSAIFADCGLGKSLSELEWSRHVHERTNKPVLNLAPLAVSKQTQREGVKFEIPANIAREQSEIKAGINITNYEMLGNFDPREFAGLVCDEASILKGDGPLRKRITDFAQHIPYRLAGTATPAPNDHVELGNHAEFLGIMSKSEMLSTFFVHDGGDTSKWRLKGHAEKTFWQWVASWAVMIRKPSDLGYSDEGFVLPPIEYHQHTVAAEWSSEYLFPVEAKGLRERQAARRDSIIPRVKLAADLANSSDEQFVFWCGLNDESEQLSAAIPDAIEVTGSNSDSHKEKTALDFMDRKIRVLVSKSSIFGFGMNFQQCHNCGFVGMSDSWEQMYQAVRRVWRFGQKMPVHAHIITGELEGAVVRNVQRKEKQASDMAESMLGYMREINAAEIHGTIRETESYSPKEKVKKPKWLVA